MKNWKCYFIQASEKFTIVQAKTRKDALALFAAINKCPVSGYMVAGVFK